MKFPLEQKLSEIPNDQVLYEENVPIEIKSPANVLPHVANVFLRHSQGGSAATDALLRGLLESIRRSPVIVPKVDAPLCLTRKIQRCHLSRYGIDRSDVTSLVAVAEKAGPGEIRGNRFAAMFRCDDMIGFVSKCPLCVW